MRGTLYEVAADFLGSGIIPAYAGNTIMAFRFAVPSLGSSPRMRGTPAPRRVGVPLIGIIPAYAGNT